MRPVSYLILKETWIFTRYIGLLFLFQTVLAFFAKATKAAVWQPLLAGLIFLVISYVADRILDSTETILIDREYNEEGDEEGEP